MYPEYQKDLDVLEIKKEASLSEIKSAYRELAKVWHPDNYRHNPKLAVRASEKLKEINSAYQRLISQIELSEKKSFDLSTKKEHSQKKERKGKTRSVFFAMTAIVIFLATFIIYHQNKNVPITESDNEWISGGPLKTPITSFKGINLLESQIQSKLLERKVISEPTINPGGSSDAEILNISYFNISDIHFQEGIVAFNSKKRFMVILLAIKDEGDYNKIYDILFEKYGIPETRVNNRAPFYDYAWHDKINGTSISMGNLASDKSPEQDLFIAYENKNNTLEQERIEKVEALKNF